MTPAVLKELMRHSNIETTMKFYVGNEAEETAKQLQRGLFVDTSVDTTIDATNLAGPVRA